MLTCPRSHKAAPKEKPIDGRPRAPTSAEVDVGATEPDFLSDLFTMFNVKDKQNEHKTR